MRYIFLVAWREYAENAKTKGFWIGLFMFPTIIFISVNVSVLLQTKGTPTRHYVLVDQSGEFAGVVNSRLEKFHPETHPFEAVSVPSGIDTNADIALLARALKPYLRGDKRIEARGEKVELSAALLIPRDIEKQIVRPGQTATNRGIEYWAANLADPTLRDEAERAVDGEIRRREYLARGLDGAVIRQIEQIHAPFASLNPNKEAGQESVNTADVIRQWAPSGFVYVLWVAIFGISQMLLNNIIEEKSNRIIEVLLSSVTPGELMLGKLFGIAGVGLTMVGVWMTSMLSVLTWKGGGANGLAGQLLLALKTSHMVPMFALYFFLGYFMYAALILSIGSVCNTIKEAQNYMAMITTSMMIPLLTMPFIPKDPNGTLARVLSWIPLYTPFTMMNRVNANPPLFDVVGTLILLGRLGRGRFVDGGKSLPRRNLAHRPAAQNCRNAALGQRVKRKWPIPLLDGQPDYFHFAFDRLEFQVGGDEFGLFAFGQRAGEGIREAKVMFILQTRGRLRQFAVHRHGLQWGCAFKSAGGIPAGLAVFAFHPVKHLGPIHRADKNRSVGLGCLKENVAHFLHARFAEKHGQQR